MTTNRRAKQDARARNEATGGSYTTARRRTSKPVPNRFEPDHCANCLQPLQPRIERLFCSELCRQTAEVVRYWRGVVRDRRIEQADVQTALSTRLAHLLAGGYAEQARRLPRATRKQVWERDQGRCRECGKPGEEIDHINGDSSSLTNLQLLCKICHHGKTAARMVPASADQQRDIKALERERVVPDEPTRLCDDRDQWATVERQLRRERRERLLQELAEHGYDPRNFPGYSWAELWDEVFGRRRLQRPRDRRRQRLGAGQLPRACDGKRRLTPAAQPGVRYHRKRIAERRVRRLRREATGRCGGGSRR